MKLSVVISVYNEEQVLPVFIREIAGTLEKDYSEYELIFVNDGSTDNSQQLIDEYAGKDNRVKSIRLSRNFGHEAAMIAGIDYATGDAVICMDSDLQHPPSLIREMTERYNNGEFEVINMARNDTKKFSFSNLFYHTLNKLTPYKIEPNASDFFLISKRVADILRQDYRERVRFLRGIIQIIGFRRTTIEFKSPHRELGKSKYSISKLLSLSVTAIATLSKKPLQAGIYIGLLSGAFSLLLAVYSIIMKIIEKPVSGYTTIVVFLGLMFSIQFFLLGIIGEYVGFLFDEQKARPIYIVDKTINIE
ncbi:MAG TPA: glycosyltransferase family 2 protein [Paludibacteraceae bacterium]|nr:glycosyltransferase family 2 protein [Paludibacteraceae bacterium]HPT42983.1 glycosyltransferase family 2 protein [Paludibacteraceae bacterium]